MFIIKPDPEINHHSVMPASTVRAYESSLSTNTDPILTISMIEPDGTLAAGVRLSRVQMLALADELLRLCECADLNEIRDAEYGKGYDDGYRDGNRDGYEHGYDSGFERGLDAAAEVYA